MKKLFTWKGTVLGVLTGILAMSALIALWTVSDSRLPQSHVAAAGSTLRSLGDHKGILMGAAVGYSLMHPLRFSKDSQGLGREGYVREATGQIAGAGS